MAVTLSCGEHHFGVARIGVEGSFPLFAVRKLQIFHLDLEGRIMADIFFLYSLMYFRNSNVIFLSWKKKETSNFLLSFVK